ncbi:MAG: C69 family dipeptidase [Paludibacteraceae bacterium]|nr:C69 family dipeptidase [Paludibacteraceae bacterium]
MKRLFSLSLICLISSLAWCCTNLIVGAGASSTGSPMTTYAADSYGLYGFLRYRASADHAEGEMRKIFDWDTGKPLGEIPEVAHTYSVIGNMNEYQLTIGETTFGGREELHDTTGIIDYGSLIYIALERCRTAREALLFMTTIVQEYGYYSEGESFTIADPHEVWIMEMIGKGGKEKGALWAAVRVPDDCITAHANQARITKLPVKGAKKLNLKKEIADYDKLYPSLKKRYTVMQNTAQGTEWLWSGDICRFGRQQGLLSSNDEEFSFADSYAPLDFTGAYACEGRVWAFLRKYDTTIDEYLPYVMHENNEHMPLFVRPSRKLTPADLRRDMRDQYEGTPLDITKSAGSGIWHSKLRYGGLIFKLDSTEYCYPRPIATQQTGWSFVSEMRADLPYGIFWFGVDDAASNVYIPFFSCAKDIPYCMAQGNGDLLTYSRTSAFWSFNTVANYTYTKYERMMPEVLFRQAEWERRFEDDMRQMPTRIEKMLPADIADYLTRYSCTQADAVVEDWHRLFELLMVKFLDGVEKKQDENGTFLRTPYGESQSPDRYKPAEEYLRSIAPKVAH